MLRGGVSWCVLKVYSIRETPVWVSAQIPVPVQGDTVYPGGVSLPRRKGRNGLRSSHSSLFPISYLEATIELLFKGISPALVPAPCYQLLRDYMNIKPVQASKTHVLSHCFTVLTLPFFFFAVLKYSCHPPTLKHVILLSDFLPNYEFQLLPRQSFRIWI